MHNIYIFIIFIIIHSDPMRITKKYAGASCIGKQVFQQCDDYFSNTSTIQENEIELQKLETLFLLRINSSKSASGIPHIVQSPIESHHSKYEIILVNKHEIRSDNASAVNNSIEDYNYNNNNSSKNKFNNSMSLTLSTTNSMMKDDEEDFGYYDDYCDEDNDDTDDDNDMLGALVDSNVNKNKDVLPSVYDYNNASPNNLYQDYSMKGTAASSSSSSSFIGKGGLSKGGRRNFSAPNLTLLHNNSSSSSYYSNSKMRNINNCNNNSMVDTINNSNIKADSESNYSSNGSSSSIIRSNSNNKLFSTHHSNRKHLLNSSSSTDQSSFLTRKRAHSVMDFAEFEKIVNDEKAAGILY